MIQGGCRAHVHNSKIMQRIYGTDSTRLFLCIKYRHKSDMIYGYARVSTDGQSVEAQVRQLAKAGCSKVFREVASGTKTDRAQLHKTLDRL
jgi:predicted site-specific integrase-resolvase